MRTEYQRKTIYFSVYQDGVRQRTAGYAGLFCRGDRCEVQLYYRDKDNQTGEGKTVRPVYLFRDGSLIEGERMLVTEGMAADTFGTERRNFLGSKKELGELEEIYIEGISDGICGGRFDGGVPMGIGNAGKIFVSEAKEVPAPEEALEEPAIALAELWEQEKTERWTFAEFMERLPELRIPSCGMRKQCCRMTLADLEHLPKEWEKIKDNQFLLHGYYEYHHFMLSRVFHAKGEHYILGIPGYWGAREQYMAENFGFSEFLPLERGKCRKNSFGYWCRSLT